MATNDIKMGYIQTATWPTPQKAKWLYFKFRPGTCTPSLWGPYARQASASWKKSQRKWLKLSKGQRQTQGFCLREGPDDCEPTKIKIIYYIPFGKQ